MKTHLDKSLRRPYDTSIGNIGLSGRFYRDLDRRGAFGQANPCWLAYSCPMPLYAGALLTGLLLAIAILMFPALRVRLWKQNLWFDWAMAAICAIGFACCWWARRHLGNLWSAGVVLKEGHHVIDTGPYGIIRHPIYTGSIVAMFAFAAARARPFDLLIALLVTLFFTCKAWLEERFLRNEFGTMYDAYRQRVPMLVPLLRLRGSR